MRRVARVCVFLGSSYLDPSPIARIALAISATASTYTPKSEKSSCDISQRHAIVAGSKALLQSSSTLPASRKVCHAEPLEKVLSGERVGDHCCTRAWRTHWSTVCRWSGESIDGNVSPLARAFPMSRMDIYSRGFDKSMKVVELRLLSGNEEICTRGGGDAGQEWSLLHSCGRSGVCVSFSSLIK